IERLSPVQLVVGHKSFGQVFERHFLFVRDESPGLNFSQPPLEKLTRHGLLLGLRTLADLAPVMVKRNPVNAATRKDPSHAADILCHFLLLLRFCMSATCRTASSVVSIIRCSPLSMRATLVRVIPSRSASSRCDRDIASLARLNSRGVML